MQSNRMVHQSGTNNASGYLKKIVVILAWTSLLAAFVYGKFIHQDDYSNILQELLREDNLTITDQKNGTLTIESSDDTNYKLRYGKSQGYGGELIIGMLYDSTMLIKDVYIVKERETVSFLSKVISKKFFQQFVGKKVNDMLQVDKDIDAVSGCTISSTGFTNAIRGAAYKAAEDDFKLEVSTPSVNWVFGLSEILVLALVFTGILSIYIKKKWLRYVAMAISLLLIGFHLNASISISHFARLMLGYLPDVHTHLVWWILIVVSLGFPFFLRKNLYCFALCPFHAAETILISISGFQLKYTRRFQKIAELVSLSLVWTAFMIIFLADNPTLGSYEPFALLFSLDGVGLQWYLLPAALIGAMFVPDFYCRYFCPVGRTLKLVRKAGRSIMGLIQKKNIGNEKEE